MQSEHAFVRNETFPSWWPNAVGKFLSVASPGFQLTLQDSTHVQVVAGPDDQAAVIAIAGLMRWNEATVNRAHPGGAAGTYDVFVTAAADSIVNTPDPFTDATNRAFALAILPAGSTPTIVAGTVDVFRKVGSVQWDGAAITGIARLVGDTPRLARVTSLPISPVDGQEIVLVADAANGVLWRLRYNALSSSPYKWEFVGGAALYNEVLASESTSSLTYTRLLTDGPQITLPILPNGGDFDITHGAFCNPAAGGASICQMSYKIGAVAAIDDDSIHQDTETFASKTRRKTALTGGAVIDAQYKVDNGTGAFADRFLSVLPVRVG